MINIFCDGGARGNPGPAAYGFLIKSDHKVIHQEGGYLGIATNNVAEYTAIIKALLWLGENCPNEPLQFYLDSKLAVSQLSGLYKVKNAILRNLIFEIRTHETNFGQIRYVHIPRHQNKEADKLVNLALDEQNQISNIKYQNGT